MAAKRRLADRYASSFAGFDGARLVQEVAGSRSNHWLNTLLLDPDQSHRRDQILAALNDAGLMARPVWTLMHRLPMYQSCPRADLSVAEDLAARVLNLPSSANLAGNA